jgi:hypothetical protein
MNDQSLANSVYKAAGRLTKESSGSLAKVVALSQAGRATELTRAAFPDITDDNVGEAVPMAFNALVRAAAVQAGVARWRVSWSAEAELVTVNGEIFDASSVGTLLADADTAARGADQLRALGIDPAAVGKTPVPEAAAYVGQVLGGIADMKSDGATYDVLILDTGLLLAEAPDGQAHAGKWRLQTLQESGSLAGLVARHRFVPFSSMELTTVSNAVTVKATIRLKDSSTLRLKARMSSEFLGVKDDDLFKQLLKRRS